MAIPAQQLEQERPRLRRITYPVRDGKPMAETDKHADEMIYGKEALRVRYADRPDVYVSGNNFVYWEEGSPRKKVSPDVYVVFGVPKRQRDSYKAWEEGGKLPAVVFEITSKKTRNVDVRKKIPLYQDELRVPECFLFDPTGDYLSPRFQGYRLKSGVYVPIPLVNNRMYSEQLRLELVVEGETLRFYDPDRREWLRTPLEQALRAEAEARARAAAEAEIARLRAEIAALKQRRTE